MGAFLRLFFVFVLTASFLDITSSCDSMENGGLPVTDAFKEKWRAVFAILDRDQSGIYTIDECFANSQQLVDFYQPSKDLIVGLMSICLQFIDVLEEYACNDATMRGYTESEFVTAYGNYWNNHFDELKEGFYEFYTTLFHAMDSDKDGAVSFAEFRLYYNEFGYSDSIEETTRTAFNLIDTDGDGFISEYEFRDIYTKYHVDPDNTANELPLF